MKYLGLCPTRCHDVGLLVVVYDEPPAVQDRNVRKRGATWTRDTRRARVIPTTSSLRLCHCLRHCCALGIAVNRTASHHHAGVVRRR